MKILLFIILLLYSGNGIAQNIEITVLNKNSQPIPYAYILINKKPVEDSDTMGIAKIPLHILHLNDTISISYLGAASESILFDESIRNSQSICFHLDESVYELNEVVVSSQNIKKLFNKSVRIMPLLNYECIMSATLQAKIDRISNVNYSGSGIIEAINKRDLPRLYTHKKPKKETIYMPDNIRYNYQIINGTQWDLVISNISIKI